MRWKGIPNRLRLIAFGLIVLAVVAIPQMAWAQETIDPTVTPTENNGGWVYWMAQGAIILGGVVVIGSIAAYLRFAPRFFRERREEEEGVRAGVKAPPVGSVRMQWQPPPQPVAAPVVAAAPVAAPAPAPAQAAPPPAPAPAQAAPAQAPAAPAPGTEGVSPPPKAAPAAERSGPAELDQETFDRVLKEELDKGTDRRVAEGRARSAAVKAARAKG